MAIGGIHTEWLFRVRRKGGFTDRRSLLDLGPQDIQTSRPYLLASITRNLDADPESTAAAIFEGDRPRRDCQKSYYSLFGIEEYRSADRDDDRADYNLDLNVPLGGMNLPVFDVVTNFGTAEHVFDIAQVFASMHDLLAPGGLALHVVPAFAFPNHGFYTPNPNVFVEFARANQYELLDFSYVDNMFVRDRTLSAVDGLDFDALRIRLEDMTDTQHFMTKVVLTFYENLVADETRRALADLAPDAETKRYPSADYHLCFVFDLVFVAMVKPRDKRPLVPPIQRMEGVAPLRM